MSASPKRAPEEHARRIARLHVLKRQFAEKYDAALIAAAADKVPASVLGHEILLAEGQPPTETSLTRAEWKLRKALRGARKRRAGNTGPAKHRARGDTEQQHVDMKLKKRIVEYYEYDEEDQPEGAHDDELGDPESESDDDLDELDDLDEHLRDSEIDDDEED